MATMMRNNIKLRRSASILLVKAETAAAAVSSCGHHHHHHHHCQLRHYQAVLLSKPRIGGASAAAGAATNNNGLLKQHPKRRDVSSSFTSSFPLPFSTATTNTSNISNNNNNNNDSDNDNDMMKLYQYAICPFCNITKAVLHYHKIPYKAIEVNPLTKSELNHLSKDYRKVPILTTTTTTTSATSTSEQRQYNGTDDIIEYLTTKKDYPTIPSSNNNNNNSTNNEFDDDNDPNYIDSSSIEEKKWISFARDELAPLLYPNICSTWSQAYETMSYVHNKPNNFSMIQKYSIQYIGSFAMYMAASKIKKKRNIVDEQKELYEILQQWEDHLKTSQVGDGGGNNNMSLGELSIYGVLRGLKGLPVHTNVMSKFPHISKWYNEMENQIEVEQEK